MPYAVAMTVTVNYAAFVSRLKTDGAVQIAKDDLPAPLDEFRRELRRAGRAAGMRVLSSAQTRWFIAWDPDHVVSDERMRAAMDAVSLDPKDG